MIEDPARLGSQKRDKSVCDRRQFGFSGLRRLAEACGERFVLGLVLHDHNRTVAFGPKRAAAPLSAPWA